MASKYKDFKVIIDDREKDGWKFEEEEKKPSKFRLAGCVTKRLETGDYTIEGCENLLVIEKKSGLNELANNFMNKDNKARFYRELERMQPFKHRYLLVEGNVDRDKLKLGIPKSRYAPPMSAVLRMVIRACIDYDVKFMFCGDAGHLVARAIMEEVLKKENELL
jgi:ERCC4-type nuclease